MSVDYLSFSRGFGQDLCLDATDTIEPQELFGFQKDPTSSGTVIPTLTNFSFDHTRFPLFNNLQAGPVNQAPSSKLPLSLPNQQESDFAAAALAVCAPSDCPSLVATSRKNSKSTTSSVEPAQCDESILPQTSSPVNSPSLNSGMSATDLLLPQFCPFGTATPDLFSDPTTFIDKTPRSETCSDFGPSATTLSIDFPISNPSFNLRLPEPKLARKRGASEVDDLAMNNDAKRQYRRDDLLPQQYVAPQDLTTTSYRTFGPAQHMPQQFNDSSLTQSPMTSYGHFANHSSFSPSNDATRAAWNSMTTRASSTPTRTPITQAGFGNQSQASSLARSATTGSAFSSPMDYSHRSNLPPSLLPPPSGYGSSVYDQQRERARASSYPYPATTRLMDVTSVPPNDMPGSTSAASSQRQKPQCWDHGCNGREFSTFSNLLRHQRERSGTAAKSYCPRCGAEFTRSTARTNHLMHSKCKPTRGGSAE